MRTLISAPMDLEFGLSAIELLMMSQLCSYEYYASTIGHRSRCDARLICDARSLGNTICRLMSIDCTLYVATNHAYDTGGGKDGSKCVITENSMD